MIDSKTNNFLRFFKLGLVTVAAGAIYPVIYMRTNFQTPMLETFGMDVATLGNMYGLMGVMFIIGYIPSGWLADRFSPRLLLSFSLLTTGLAGLWYAQVPSYRMIKIIFLIWGFSSVFTFWGAHMKIVKLLAKKDEQGRFFGILDGGRGLVEAVLATIGVTIFSSIVSKQGALEATSRGLINVIYFYSLIDVLMAVLILFAFRDEKEEETPAMASHEKTSFFKNILTTLKIPEIWLMSGIIFCGYSVYWTVYYFGGYLQTNHNAGVILSGYLTVVILWMRPIGGIVGGFLADRFGRPRVLGAVLALACIGLLALAKFPLGTPIIFVFALVIFVGLMLYFIRGLYWSLLDYCNLPASTMGFSIGIISFMGYSPDIFIPKWSAPIFLKYQDGAGAYSGYFIGTVIFGTIGLLLLIYLNHRIKNKI